MKRINFAACYGIYSEKEEYIKLTKKDIEMFKIPPIKFITTEKFHHLTIDMFHNGFVWKEQKKIVQPELFDRPVWKEQKIVQSELFNRPV